MTLPKVAAEEIRKLREKGVAIDSLECGGQSYARVRGLTAPSPPWDRTEYQILVAIPAAYGEGASLDAFYLGLPYTFKGGTHPRVASGAVMSAEGLEWQLTSWHYPDGKPWSQVLGDTLETHIIHCTGFFAHRGATNAY